MPIGTDPASGGAKGNAPQSGSIFINFGRYPLGTFDLVSFKKVHKTYNDLVSFYIWCDTICELNKKSRIRAIIGLPT
jgi:hypothetical protein